MFHLTMLQSLIPPCLCSALTPRVPDLWRNWDLHRIHGLNPLSSKVPFPWVFGHLWLADEQPVSSKSLWSSWFCFQNPYRPPPWNGTHRLRPRSSALLPVIWIVTETLWSVCSPYCGLPDPWLMDWQPLAQPGQGALLIACQLCENHRENSPWLFRKERNESESLYLDSSSVSLCFLFPTGVCQFSDPSSIFSPFLSWLSLQFSSSLCQLCSALKQHLHCLWQELWERSHGDEARTRIKFIILLEQGI